VSRSIFVAIADEDTARSSAVYFHVMPNVIVSPTPFVANNITRESPVLCETRPRPDSGDTALSSVARALHATSVPAYEGQSRTC
jgi:hypothetical protein